MQRAKVRGELREEEGWREKCKLDEKIQLINKKILKKKKVVSMKILQLV